MALLSHSFGFAQWVVVAVGDVGDGGEARG